MKNPLLPILLLALPILAAGAPTVKTTPAPAATSSASSAAVLGEEDEVDLKEVDDSAVAAKGRPVVKLATAPQSTPAQTEVPDTEPADTNALAATGTAIAAKYLAGNESARINISADEATLADILRQFRKTTNANIIYAESTNLQQRVSISLSNVPWLEAMTSILNSRGFRVESSSGIHFVKEDKLAIPVFTRSFVLNHASADELAKLFNESYGRKDQNGKLLQGVATAFQGANTIVVSAPERVLADCEKIVASVDKAVPQIYIEARFIELSNEALHKLGVQWNQLESWGATVKDLEGGMSYGNDRGKTVGLSWDKGLSVTDVTKSSDGQSNAANVNNNILSSSAGSSVDSSFSSTSTGTRNSSRSRNSTSDSDYSRAFSGQLSVDDFNLALSAFESMSDVKIFSNPKIIVSNGKEAKVDMTTKFPNVRIQATRNSSNGSDSLDISTQLEVIPGEDKLLFAREAFFSWGITLSVKPRISPDGLISVEITPQISQLDTSVVMDNNQIPNGFVQVKGGDSSAMSYYPVIEVKRLTTDFTMKDGATAVIGGLSKTTEEDIDSGIPYLREIPGIGPRLFGWKSRGKVQKEIIVFVTVGIADPADLKKDIGLPKNAIMGREFVEGRQLEPGERPNAAAEAVKLDLRSIEERHARPNDKKSEPEQKPVSDEDTRGKVSITPVEAAAAPARPARELDVGPVALPPSYSGSVNITPVI